MVLLQWMGVVVVANLVKGGFLRRKQFRHLTQHPETHQNQNKHNYNPTPRKPPRSPKTQKINIIVTQHCIQKIGTGMLCKNGFGSPKSAEHLVHNFDERNPTSRNPPKPEQTQLQPNTQKTTQVTQNTENKHNCNTTLHTQNWHRHVV